MSKITNDSLTRSGTGCFIAVPNMTTVSFKGLDTHVTVCVCHVELKDLHTENL